MLLAYWPPQKGCEMQNLGPHSSPTKLEAAFYQNPQVIFMLISDDTRSTGVDLKKKKKEHGF